MTTSRATRRTSSESLLADKGILSHQELYKWLKARYTELRLRDAAQFEREIRSAAGRLTVVVPRSLHGALKTEAAYIGAIGSRGTHAARFERMQKWGVSPDELRRVYAPIGLDLVGRTPEESRA